MDQALALAGDLRDEDARARFRRFLEVGMGDLEEAREFLADYGIEEPGLNRAIALCYSMLGLQSFFTVGEDEVRAWTGSVSNTAPQAAGVIHSDLQRGFIRAEVYTYEDLMEAGSEAELRKLGKLRLEGKEYIVQDGDIMSIRFNL